MTDSADLLDISGFNAEEFAAINAQRAGTYAFLARMFRAEPTQDVIDELREMRFPAETGIAEMDEGYRLLAKQMCEVWEDSLSVFRVDFARAFIGHGVDAFSAAYPFESIYTSERRLLMQAARDEALAIYRSENVDKTEGWTEGEDHISAEFEFMSILANRAVAAVRAGNDGEVARLMRVQRNFAIDHLASWVPLFCVDVRKFAQTKFYQGVSLLAEGYVGEDTEFLKSLFEKKKEEAQEEIEQA